MTDAEVYRYRLEKAEERIADIEKTVQALDRQLMKNRLDEYEIEHLKTVAEGLGKKLDAIQSEWPTVILYRDRVSHVMKYLLTAFCGVVVAALVWAVKQGAL